jgi:glycosyltransferase involved in cell wall biosynthesis
MNNLSLHQLVSGFAGGDAISHEALALRDICRGAGFTADIFAPAERIAPHMRPVCRPLDEFPGRQTDIVLLHYSIASPATDCFLASSARRILIYHNITPAEYFRPYDDEMAARLSEARRALPDIARQAEAVWADSAFNAVELAQCGIDKARIFPLLFTPQTYDLPPDPQVLARFSRPMTNLLFVGRMAPNKCIEDLIRAFAHFNALTPQSRLLIVGSAQSAPAYYAMLRLYAAELELPNVCFEHFASPAGLAAYYTVADVFVTTSRHEGYCLPVVEAMYKNVPVIARRTGGVPEAMGNAGVLFDALQPAELAELIGMVTEAGALRAEILESQRLRLQSLLRRSARDEVLDLLADLIPAR